MRLTETRLRGVNRGFSCWLMLLLWGMVSVAVSCLADDQDVRRDAAVEAIERVMPSVVNIGTETIVERNGFYEDLLREFWGPYYRRRAPDARYSLGSGVIIDPAGYVLTNFHVVRRANRIWVKMADGTVYEADPVGQTRQSDVALLKLRCKPDEKFQTARFGEDDDLLLGETVLALGNPFGLGGSVSRGILSSKNRRPLAENEPLDVADWLQTDAAINPGSSGGPLINLRGEVIGINVAIYREGQGIGFAVPIKLVAESLAEIYTPETIKGIWFGGRVRPGHLPLRVLSVQPGSPADQAGLKAGDIISSVNGKPPGSFIEFNGKLIDIGDQEPVALEVLRGNESKKLSVRQTMEKTFFNSELIRGKIGVSLQPLTRELAEALGLITNEGLIMAGVDNDGPAATAGLQQRMVVQAIDDQPTNDIVTAAKILYAKKKGDKVVLSIMSERTIGRFIQMRPGKVEISVR